ncbi:hypothetical protein LSH36_189g01001 [Paralvinella palmiformis]|uniref:Uncharacterized protein n=1 Tax=Paralvinella palmiformis TaxID=53620 RepID=A0AAD9JS02_9ANNE|nr:hypothetical protein LSH36_189g01001 [Paralvinella palmiformis]
MLKIAVLLLAVASLCSSYPLPYWPAYPYVGFPYNLWGGLWGYSYYQPQANYGAKLVFCGDFTGTCEDKPDGLYYVDERNFAYCFSGKKTIQPCADGSANPPLEFFNQGGYYGMADFCSVNLVAQGYGYPPRAVPYYNSVPQDKPYEQFPKPVY